jgi:hypothetical protein
MAAIAGGFMVSSAAAPLHPALTGEWGGFQSRLTLDDAGGRLELDCASASLDSTVRPDADGKFSVDGRFEAYAPGPDRRGDMAPAFTEAHFNGQIDGRNLQLTVHLAGQEKPQEFALVRDRKIKIIRCY